MDASAEPLDEGLRILARIIARDWARHHSSKGCVEMKADAPTMNKQSPAEAEPVSVA